MSDRSRRRCVLRKTAVPDATHYVGYVEDDETPEMIMKKFEEMERIKAASKKSSSSVAADQTAAGPSSSKSAAAAGAGDAPAAGAGQQRADTAAAATAAAAAAAAATGDVDAEEGPLDQQQLQEIFKATSMYNVKSLLANNEALMVDAAANKQQLGDRGPAADIDFDSESEDDLVAELRGFWSDDDWSKPHKKKEGGRGRGRPRGEGSSRGRAKGMQRNARTCIIAQYNRDTHAFIRRRVRVADPDAILQLRLPPPPLPLSWGRAIRPFKPAVVATADAAAAAAAAAAADDDGSVQQAVVPLGLVSQPYALPASRNCSPRVYDHTSSSRSSSSQAGVSGSGDAPSQVHLASDLTAFDFKQLQVQDYQAVLINTGWEAPYPQQQQQQQQEPAAGPGPSSTAAAAAGAGSAAAAAAGPGVCSWGLGSDAHAWHVGSSGAGSSVTSRLEQLPIPSLCARGFIMIWANKEHCSAVFRLMSRWGFSYVENLTWVLLAPNHSILELPCGNVQRSHITLYIFRKDGEGRDIELRHQRNPDVVFDYVRAVQGREWDVPVEVFDSIETLLPTGKDLFLELWAPTQAGRAGWTHVVEQQQEVA